MGRVNANMSAVLMGFTVAGKYLMIKHFVTSTVISANQIGRCVFPLFIFNFPRLFILNTFLFLILLILYRNYGSAPDANYSSALDRNYSSGPLC